MLQQNNGWMDVSNSNRGESNGRNLLANLGLMGTAIFPEMKYVI